jgi:hypothetical protein
MNAGGDSHIEWMVHRELSHEVHLDRERRALPSLIASGEELLAVASSSMNFGRPGILAITDRRLVHLYFRRIARRMAVTEIGYAGIESIRHESSGTAVAFAVRLAGHGGPIDFMLRTSNERATELVDCARRAMRRVQEPIENTDPWKKVGW